MLGRIKLIRDAVAADRADYLSASYAESTTAKQLGNEAYAWCWAAAKLLDSHPRYRDRFRELRTHVLDPNFNELSEREYADDWPELHAEWQAFIATLDHGYDFERMAIDFQPGRPLGQPASESRSPPTAAGNRPACGSKGKSYRVAASGPLSNRHRTNRRRSTTVALRAGRRHDRISRRPAARNVARRDRRMASGDEQAPSTASFAEPIEIGLSTTITPTASGTLYLRVNDSAARLDDNRGTLTVTIEEQNEANTAIANRKVRLTAHVVLLLTRYCLDRTMSKS